MKARWDSQNARKIVKRMVITGTLELLTPARFGGGQERPGRARNTDMPLARDPLTGNPLLSGTSITGAARAYLRDCEFGYEVETNDRLRKGQSLTQLLFGDVLDELPEEQRESRTSWLVVEDSIAQPAATETRPGVAIDPKKRTAKTDGKGKGFLYDFELLPAGTQFELHLELALPDSDVSLPDGGRLQDKLLQGLAMALTGFENGEIGLGTRKRRGLGECIVKEWHVMEYDLQKPDGMIAWLEGENGVSKPAGKIATQLGLDPATLPDDRRRFTLNAHFLLTGSLLIRSGSDEPDAPDMGHLKSGRIDSDGNHQLRPILPGSSLAGAMRARALRIARTVLDDETAAKTLVNELFGPTEIQSSHRRKDVWASRAAIREREVRNEYEQVQSRVRIDRFTGGTYPGALFEQQPVLGKRPRTDDQKYHHIEVEVELRKPKEAHVGLLLQVLKDLWTGDLPVGGESNVGRGRLQGVYARLEWKTPAKSECWEITAADPHSTLSSVEGIRPQSVQITGGNPERLEAFAQALGGDA